VRVGIFIVGVLSVIYLVGCCTSTEIIREIKVPTEGKKDTVEIISKNIAYKDAVLPDNPLIPVCLLRFFTFA